MQTKATSDQLITDFAQLVVGGRYYCLPPEQAELFGDIELPFDGQVFTVLSPRFLQLKGGFRRAPALSVVVKVEGKSYEQDVEGESLFLHRLGFSHSLHEWVREQPPNIRVFRAKDGRHSHAD